VVVAHQDEDLTKAWEIPISHANVIPQVVDVPHRKMISAVASVNAIVRMMEMETTKK
jgi:hypothetical protein